ncbi:MAG: MBL fold metallo-hydrolase [Leptospiraceae bacterium]|nr:MBL fold metallo-hydrolase [Leptospiraceae bacterium]MDW7976672.1 MBL fold metallo-hydrolase [Leptospiraceae bacterium]
MKVKLYGVRGSIPTPLSTKEYRMKIKEILKRAIRQSIKEDQIDAFIKGLPLNLSYVIGGNTTCVRVQTKEKFYIIDAGTGLRVLGEEIITMQKETSRSHDSNRLSQTIPKELHIFLTHTHWDHIQGLPFFKPLYLPDYTLHFYSPFPDIQERLEYQTEQRFFPAPITKTASKKFYHYIPPKSIFTLEKEIEITTFPLKHPGGCFSYKFINKVTGKTFIFATDVEFTGEDFIERSEFLEYFGGADVLVLDAQYTLDESFMKIDWGHTSNTMAVNCATQWKVKNLFLTHHEPTYKDSMIYENYKHAIEHREKLNASKPNIYLAIEGLEIVL